MAFKVVILALFVAAAQGSGINGGDYSSFSYGVSDPHTGDVKSQQETRQGDNVVGQYSLLESDGTRRTVDYAATAHTGFNAIVRKDPAIIGHAAPAVAAPIAYAAPQSYAAAPAVATSAYSTSVAHGGYAAPVAYGGYSAAPIAHGAYSAPLSHAAPLAHSAYGAAPLAYGAYGAAPLTHGAYGSPLAGAYGLGAGWGY